jgi:hypothetical protein
MLPRPARAEAHALAPDLLADPDHNFEFGRCLVTARRATAAPAGPARAGLQLWDKGSYHLEPWVVLCNTPGVLYHTMAM